LAERNVFEQFFYSSCGLGYSKGTLDRENYTLDPTFIVCFPMLLSESSF